MNSIQQYEHKKEKLLKQYQKLIQENQKEFTLFKDTSNLFRNFKEKKKKLDVRGFNKVLKVDVESKLAEIEGMCTYEEIVKETLKYGHLPTVIPELKTITIGGALSGVGIESSSYRFGLVHETIVEYEVLLGNGKTIVCRADNEYKDLFYAFPNSYGTLGYALKVKVKLIPVEKFVKLSHFLIDNHTPFSDKPFSSYFFEINKLCLERMKTPLLTYIDGVYFSHNKMTITTAKMIDDLKQKPKRKINRFLSNYKWLNIYYQSLLSKKEDYLTIEDYIWRWDTDWFWCSKHFFMQNRGLRLFFGKWTLNSKFYWKIRNLFNNKLGNSVLKFLNGPRETIIQDIQVSIDKASEFLDFFEREIKIKPVWICPIKPYSKIPYTFYKMNPNVLYINFGFWDTVQSTKEPGYYNRLIEKKVIELGGNKSLYSSSYYSEAEFWTIYDRNSYISLKSKYDPNNILGGLYEKCVKRKR